MYKPQEETILFEGKTNDVVYQVVAKPSQKGTYNAFRIFSEYERDGEIRRSYTFAPWRLNDVREAINRLEIFLSDRKRAKPAGAPGNDSYDSSISKNNLSDDEPF